MKKIIFAGAFLLILAGCGTKQLDNMNMTWSTTDSGAAVQNTDPYAGADVEHFTGGSDTVVDETGSINDSWQVKGQTVTDMKASRASDEWCVWKKYSKYGVSFLWEQCELDWRSLEIQTLDDKQVFAIKQDDYDIDPENLDDTLAVQVIDTKWSTIADAIKKVAGATCDITKVTDKTIWSFDLYTLKDSSTTGDGTCSGYADLNADASKIFLVDSTKSNKIVFMNLTNQQNTIDLNNFKLD